MKSHTELVFTHPEPAVIEVAVRSVGSGHMEDHLALALPLEGDGLTEEEQVQLELLLEVVFCVCCARR